MSKLLKNIFNNHFEQSYKYFLVGVACFVVDFVILLAFLKFTKINYLIASAISYSVGIILNYVTSIKWIFKKRTYKKQWKKEFGSFSIIEISALVFMTSTLFVMFGIFRVPVLIAKVIANIVSGIYNYLLKFKLLFAKDENEALT